MDVDGQAVYRRFAATREAIVAAHLHAGLDEGPLELGTVQERTPDES